MLDRDFLCFLHQRLEHVYGENPLSDYMHKLRAIIADTPKERETRTDGRGGNSFEELTRRLDENQNSAGY